MREVSDENSNANFDEVKHKLQNLKGFAIRSVKTLTAMDIFLQENFRCDVLDWVFPTGGTGHATIRNKLQEDVREDAGKWLLERTEFGKWEMEEGAAGLRIEGEAGTGKTILTSTVFEHLQNKYGAAGTTGIPIAVFYCSGVRDSYERTTTGHTNSAASDILRYILRQLGQAPEGFQLLAAAYNSQPKKAEPLQLRDTKRLICDLVKMHDRSYIVLDAMDECLTVGQDAERLNLMELFRDLLDLQVSVKIFFSSRFEPDIQERTGSWDITPLTQALTKMDLDNFVDLTINRKLQGKKNCDDGLKKQLREELKKKANGNFRWAQVSLDYICEPTRPAFDLITVLRSIPRELNEFYFRLLSEVREDKSDFNQTLGMRAIKFLHATTVLKIGLNTEPFLKAIKTNTKYEDQHVCVDDVRVACHHLVTWDEVSDSFEFGHFSVAEFFNADHQQISREFNLSAIWLLFSGDLVNRISKISRLASLASGMTDAPVRLPDYQKEAEIYWQLFCCNLNEFWTNFLQEFHQRRLEPNLDRSLRSIKVAVLADGTDLTAMSVKAIREGESFYSINDLARPWWLATTNGNRFGGTQIMSAIHRINPYCEIYVGRVC